MNDTVISNEKANDCFLDCVESNHLESHVADNYVSNLDDCFLDVDNSFVMGMRNTCSEASRLLLDRLMRGEETSNEEETSRQVGVMRHLGI